MPLFECVPNISEGRDATTIAALAEVVGATRGVRLLDRTSDPAHHRTVFTFVGDGPSVADAAVALAERTAQLVDLRRHDGIHPRVGALDVVPFVPLRDASMDDAVAVARDAAARIAERIGAPVFLYEHAAVRPERRQLEVIRRGGLDALTDRMRTPEWAPDFGPAAPHPSAGVVIAGARDLLVAWNLDLETADVGIAQAIARDIRASNGGFAGLKAIGLWLAHRGRAQVSMNLTDFRVTPMHVVFERVQQAAEAHDTRIHDSEIIGLVPRAALAAAAPHAPFLAERHAGQVLEDRLGI